MYAGNTRDGKKILWSIPELLRYINSKYNQRYKLHQLDYLIKRSGKVDREKYLIAPSQYYFTEKDAKEIYEILKETVRI